MPPSSQGIPLPSHCCVQRWIDRFGGRADDATRASIVARITPIELSSPDGLSPLLSRRFLKAASQAEGVLLVEESIASSVEASRCWVHPHAAWVLSQILSDLQSTTLSSVHPTAIVDCDAHVGKDVDVGPGTIIMGDSEVGEGSIIGPHAVVYSRVRIGKRVVVGAGAVIGRPGFGWVRGPQGQVSRMPQLGGVVIEDDVEVGAMCTVDAGTLGPTVLASGCRLDAHVHVGHNVRIGAATMVAAQSGFAGSSRIGRGVLIGGQSGVADHVQVGDGAQLGGGSGVIGDIPARAVVAGYPAVDRVRWLRSIAKAMRGKST